MASSLPPLLLVVVVSLAGAAKLPSSLKTCKQTDPDYNGCLKKAIQDAVPVLTKGDPSLVDMEVSKRTVEYYHILDLPPIDPMHFTQIKIEGTPERPVTLKLEFNEVDVTGMANAVVDSIEMEPGSYNIKAKVHADSPFSLTGQYKADGRILVLPIKGEGNIRLSSPRLDADLEMIGKPTERGGETYWDVTDFKVTLKNWNKLTIDMTGLFNNDKLLADNTLLFLNENSAEIANELKPALEDAVRAAFKQIAKRLFDKVPYNSVFPPA